MNHIRMTEPHLAGEEVRDVPRQDQSRQKRAAATRHVLIHWLNDSGEVTHTTQEHIPSAMLTAAGYGIRATEFWWDTSGRIFTSPLRRGMTEDDNS